MEISEPATTRFCRLVGVRAPIMQDGMGPWRTGRLAAAVSEAGGLGSVSMPGMTKDPRDGARLLREQIEQVATLTDAPFAVNVPVGRAPDGEVLPVSEAYISEAIKVHAEGDKAGGQLCAVTTSAGFAGAYTARLHDAGLLHIQKVGALRHAQKAVANGTDVLIASGYEMGGHTHEHPVHTIVLAAEVIAAVDVPVLVSGGIYDARGLAAALAMGGAGVAMGTRFIATLENDWHPAYKEKILAAGEWSDVIFPGVYGPARGLGSRGVETLRAMGSDPAVSDADLTAWKDEAMIAAQRDGEVEDGLLPAGQCAAAITDVVPVADLIADMLGGAERLLRDAQRSL